MNGVKAGIKLQDDETYSDILGLVELTLPEQDFNTVDMPSLNDEDLITPRLKGSRNGNDLTMVVNVSNETNEGLNKIIEANENTDNATNTVGFEITFSSGAKCTINRARVTKCAPSSGGKDALITYSITAVVNSKMIFSNAGA